MVGLMPSFIRRKKFYHYGTPTRPEPLAIWEKRGEDYIYVSTEDGQVIGMVREFYRTKGVWEAKSNWDTAIGQYSTIENAKTAVEQYRLGEKPRFE